MFFGDGSKISRTDSTLIFRHWCKITIIISFEVCVVLNLIIFHLVTSVVISYFYDGQCRAMLSHELIV